MCEGGTVASVAVIRFFHKVNAVCFQKAWIGDEGILPELYGKRDIVNVFLKKRAPKQFIPQVRGDAIVEECARIEHGRVNLLFQHLFFVETGFTQIPALNISFGRDGGAVAADHVRSICFCGAAHPLVHGWGDPVIAVNESDIGPLRLPEAFLSRRHMAAVLLVETADAPVLCGIVITEGFGAVGGTVVYEKNFKVRKGLGENAVKAVGKVAFYIIHGDDDTQKRCGHGILL